MKLNKLKVGFFIAVFTFLCTVNVSAQPERSQNRQQRPSTEEIFKMMDANEDGKLSLEEVKGPLKNDFTKIDTNENGFITKEELEKAPKPDRQKGQAEGNQNDGSVLKIMDTNKDGKLSKAEAKGRIKDNFSKIDTNEDDFLSKEELDKAHKPK